jgi:hypothetical protein
MIIFILTTAELMLSADLYFKPNMLLGFLWLGWYLYAKSKGRPVPEAVVA